MALPRMTPEPFCCGLGDFYFPAAAHEEAAARIGYLADCGRGGLISGPSGVGKSLTLLLAADELRRCRRTVLHVDLAHAESDSDVEVRIAQSAGQSPEALSDFANGHRLMGGRVVLLLDHVEQAENHTASALRHFANISVVAATSRPVGESLCRHFDLAIPLEGLRDDELASYLAAGLEAGGRDDLHFDDRAVAAIAQRAGGRPREIDRIAHLSVVAATADGLSQITGEIVDGVSVELPQVLTAA